jgi:hypothetical protein
VINYSKMHAKLPKKDPFFPLQPGHSQISWGSSHIMFNFSSANKVAKAARDATAAAARTAALAALQKSQGEPLACTTGFPIVCKEYVRKSVLARNSSIDGKALAANFKRVWVATNLDSTKTRLTNEKAVMEWCANHTAAVKEAARQAQALSGVKTVTELKRSYTLPPQNTASASALTGTSVIVDGPQMLRLVQTAASTCAACGKGEK